LIILFLARWQIIFQPQKSPVNTGLVAGVSF
jgi:hypothetical protein